MDNDLAALLPEPPPPRPARREVAMAEALRRFDGAEAAAPPTASPARARQGWSRPQLAAFASAALVIMVSVPIFWAERDSIRSGNRPDTSPADYEAADAPSPARTPTQTVAVDIPQSPAPAAVPEPAAADQAEPAAQAAPAAVPAPAAVEANLNKLPQFAPAPAPPPPPPPPPPPAPAARLAQAEGRAPAAKAESDSSIVVTGSRVVRPDYSANSPAVTVSEAFLAEGGWNDCTLRDPRRDLAACRALADPAARGAAGRAAAQLADGLTLAWQGDLDRAIAAFDRAIASDPDLALAYLNRGLAWQDKGDLRRARADLDRAVAHDRGSARVYYHRSLLHRERGDDARADADARRAAERDPAYRR